MIEIEYNSQKDKVFFDLTFSLGHKINSVIREKHLGAIPGKVFDFMKLTPGYREVVDKRNGSVKRVKYNSIIPNTELFSLAQDLVQPAIEEFEASNIFVSDSGYSPGAETVGADIISRTGKARLAVRGVEKGDIPRADMSIGRHTQVIGKLDDYIRVTLDEIQRVAARNQAGLAPMVDLMSEKLNAARWLIGRDREMLIWRGGFVEDISIGITSIFSYFTTTESGVNGWASATPKFGKQSIVATEETVVTWDAKLGLPSGKGPMYIQQDLSEALAYVQRLGTYKVTHFVLPRRWLNKLSTMPYSALNPTPILNVLKQAFPGIEFVGTTALDYKYNTDLTALKSGFLAIDARKQNWVIADPEPINFLNAVVDKEGAVEQVARAQCAGILSKHPSSAAFFTGIDA